MKVYILLKYTGKECKVLKVYKYRNSAIMRECRELSKNDSKKVSYHIISKSISDWDLFLINIIKGEYNV